MLCRPSGSDLVTGNCLDPDVVACLQEEFELIVEERQLRSKFNELEQLVAEARTKGKDAR